MHQRDKKTRKKLCDTVTNLHNQTASYLSKNYQKILLPEFGTSKLVIGDLAPSVKNEMMSYRFYDFKMKLNHLCNINGSKLNIVNESFTTRTCTRCGTLNNAIGGKKVFHCSTCKLTIDRDINGARNILLKRLG